MRERGSMSVFTVLFSVVAFLLAGLLVDGGGAINARLRAADVAEQAARAGADQIDVDQLHADGETRLLGEDQVCARADEIVAAQGDDVRGGRCAVEQNQVTVTVSVRWQAFFLGAIGFPGSDLTGEATAAPQAR
ncbi:Tad domain-containing protein [Actinomadura sp. ATCC 31491]|uniref:Tad domain-containing protein n=1 Tax=Actinomadura luzonensis TaxID=2805427 RepID=A0ABT0G9J7_9ACTN|nr:flp pilus-assembly TadE/G-like family protein [Actinomadura luzonensis]MCK2221273.1 Tad domain-containing protein [Actinomadura luzonensis]